VSSFSLNPAQAIIHNLHTPTLVYQGGQGSGKTTSGAHACIRRASICPPGTLFGAVSPNYQMSNRNVVQTLKDECKRLGISYLWKASAREFHVLNAIIQVSSADKPNAIAGTWSFAWLDESGQMGESAFKEVDGRLRGRGLPVPQTILTSTPDGTRTRQQEIIREAQEWTGKPQACPVSVVIAPTLINRRNLPQEYVERLLRTYANDPAGKSNRILGIAADASGGIYTNLTPANVQPYTYEIGDQIVLGWDFNVHWMVTTSQMWRARTNTLHVIGSVTSAQERSTTTEEHARKVAEAVKQVGAKYHNGRWLNADLSQVVACIDASGKSPHSNASWTDEQIVRAAGFQPKHSGANPPVKDRIATVQYALAHRHLLFDPRATDVLRAMREHPYGKDGSPKKWSGWKDGEFQCDHYTDALGYVTCQFTPMRRLTWR
jgi:hypothetical protein